MRAFGSSNAKVAEYGCWTIGNLTNNDVNSVTLGSLGGCECVVAAMRAFGSSNAKVAEDGCMVIGTLACNNDANRVTLGSLGGLSV